MAGLLSHACYNCCGPAFPICYFVQARATYQLSSHTPGGGSCYALTYISDLIGGAQKHPDHFKLLERDIVISILWILKMRNEIREEQILAFSKFQITVTCHFDNNAVPVFVVIFHD